MRSEVNCCLAGFWLRWQQWKNANLLTGIEGISVGQFLEGKILEQSMRTCLGIGFVLDGQRKLQQLVLTNGAGGDASADRHFR